MDERDALAAEELLRFALFKEVVRAERRKKRKLNTGQPVNGDDDEEDDAEEDEEEDQTHPERMQMPEGQGVTGTQQERAAEKNRRLEGERPGGDADEDDVDMGLEAEAEAEADAGAEAAGAEADGADTGDIEPSRLALFRERLDVVFTTSGAADTGMVELLELVPLINEGMGTADMFGSREARRAVEAMHGRNEVMFSEGTVYKV